MARRPASTKSRDAASSRSTTVGAMMPTQTDASGADSARIGGKGPKVGAAISVRPPYLARETHPFVGNITIDRAQSLIVQALLGQPRMLMDAYDDMRDRCPRLDAVCGTRVYAIQGRPWSVKPGAGAETDREAIAVAQKVTRIVQRIPHWKRTIGHLADGILRGYSVNQNVWGLNIDGYHAPTEIEWIHPNRIAVDANLKWCLQEWNGSWPGTQLDSYGEDRFIIHSPSAGRAAYPTRRGVLLSCLLTSLVERMGLRWWLRACERWGQPQVYAVVPEGDQELLNKATQLLRALSDDWQAALSGKIELNKIDGSGDFTGEAHDKLLQLIYTTYSIRILGHNLMSEVQGGSYAAAQVGNFVRQDILAADCEELDDTITSQLIEPIQKYNFPGSPPLLYETRTSQRQKLTAQDYQTGAFTTDEYRDGSGYEGLPDGAGAIRPPMVQVSGSPVASAPPFLGPSAASMPAGGADAASPFAPKSSPTSSRTQHPLRLALLER